MASIDPMCTEFVQFGFKKTFADEFELGHMLGSGSFGTVHVAIERATGFKYAVKSIPKRFFGQFLEPHFVARIQHEVDVYRHMGQSLNVAHLHGAYEDGVVVDLVMELCSGGDMWRRIQRGSYSEKRAAGLVREVLQAIAQCHAKGIILRDCKPENFLFLNEREDAPLKMVDFGLADYCLPGQYLSERCGTPAYVAPEVLRQRYSVHADVWSAGILAYYLLAGRFPWHNDLDLRQAAEQEGIGEDVSGNLKLTTKLLFRAIMYSEFDFSWPPWDAISADGKAFVQSMLSRDPEQRPTAAQLLGHPWMVRSGEPGGDGDTALDDTLVQRLQRYGTYGRLKQLALRNMASVMATDDSTLAGLREAFSVLDRDGSGQVPYSDLVAHLNSGRYDLSPVEIRTLMSQFDLNRDGCVDVSEWMAALIDWRQLQEDPQWDKWVGKVFAAFDVDGSGEIGREELAAILCPGDGEAECAPDTIDSALREADANRNGAIGLDEFAALLQTSQADRLELFASRRLKEGETQRAQAPRPRGVAAPPP